MNDLEKPKISFTVVCQDEEEVIGQCIRHMKKMADVVSGLSEFVIVDGGSEDKTLTIINNLKDQRFKIIENPWSGSISDQRNVSQRACSGEWILFLDADEVFTDNIFNKINGLITNKEASAYSFSGVNLLGDIEHMWDHPGHKVVRLMRNLKQFEWRRSEVALEHLYFGDRVIHMHPAHFTFRSWQRFEKGVRVIHFHMLKSVESVIKRRLRQTSLKGNHWFGMDEKTVRKRVIQARVKHVHFTGEVRNYKICLVKDRLKGLTFHSEF